MQLAKGSPEEERSSGTGNSGQPIDRHDEFARLLEEGVRVRDLWKLVRSFRVTTISTIVGFLFVVAGVGYKIYPILNTATDPPIRRVVPKHVNVAQILLPSSAQDQFPFLVPPIAYLEDEAASEIKAGHWTDSLPIVAISEPLSQATREFKVRITPNEDQKISGYAYRVYTSENARQYEPLVVTRKNTVNDQSSIAFVPESDAGDTLLFVLRISSPARIPVEESDLRDAINIAVVGG